MSDDPRTPTLDELAALFAAVRLARATRDEESMEIVVSFRISMQDLEEAGVAFRSFPSAIFSEVVEHLQRLQSIDETTAQYRDADRKGSTAADCVAFIQNEMKNISPGNGLQQRMQRQMFAKTIEKLTELGVWRAAVDAERFQNQREAERKRQANQKRRYEEAARQRYEEAQAWAQAEAKRKQQEGFWDNKRGSRYSFDDKEFRERWEEAFRTTSGGSSSFHDFFKDAFSGRDRAYSEETFNYNKAKPNAGKRPWYTVLGVSATASKDEIKKAYRKLASKYHPDRCKDADAGERMAEINAARDLGLF